MVEPDAMENQLKAMPMDRYLAEMRQLQDYVKKNSTDWQARYALALFFLRTESRSEAVLHLKKAHKLNPKSELVLKRLSEVLFLEMKQYKAAIVYLKRWAKLRKDQAVLWIYIAECENHLGNPSAALAALDEVERIEPDHPEFKLTRADVYTKMGDEVAAQRDYEDTISQTGKLIAVSKLIALPNYQLSVAKLTEYKTQAEAAENSSDIPKGIMFSELGGAFEKAGEFELAFECFQNANALRLPHLDRDAQLAMFKNVKATFTREFFFKNSGRGHPSKQPIFVVGMPRSGTTLTESILAAHPNIVGNGELSYFEKLIYNYSSKTSQTNLLEGHLPGLSDYFANAPNDWQMQLGEGYLSDSGFRRKDKRLQVDKMPHNFLALGFIHLVFPNAKIIHCRRHPIDGALSCYKASMSEFHDYATDLSFLGSYYRNYWTLMDYWREALPGKMFEVYYEHMVSDTEKVARDMISHVGLEWSDKCLDHTRSSASVRTASQWQVRQPVYTSSVTKWRNYETQLQPLITSLGSIVSEYEVELAKNQQ